MQTPRNITYTRPKLYQKQERAIFSPTRYAVIEASTKAGKTVGCMAWLLELALKGKEGQQFWWVGPSREQSKIAYSRYKRGLPQEVYTANDSELSLRLITGAIIRFKTAEIPDLLYGEDVHAAVVDEATRCREDAWTALRTTLTATRGPVRIIGNVKGKKNWAYRFARRAESGEPDTHYAKLTAFDAIEAGVLSKEEVEDARRHLPENVFKELYLAEASDDDGNPFGITAIRRCISRVSNNPPAVYGVDLAKSVDWTVIIGLDKDHTVCHFERFQSPWSETFERIKRVVGKTPALIDSTGVGDPIVEGLQKLGSNYQGFKFTQGSKQQVMEGLAVRIQQEDIHFPDGPIVSELESFEYIYTRTGVKYSAPDGQHDDCVVALGLANSLKPLKKVLYA